MVGRLLGYNRVETTARYTYLAKESVWDAASWINDSIAADALGGYPVRGSPSVGNGSSARSAFRSRQAKPEIPDCDPEYWLSRNSSKLLRFRLPEPA